MDKKDNKKELANSLKKLKTKKGIYSSKTKDKIKKEIEKMNKEYFKNYFKKIDFFEQQLLKEKSLYCFLQKDLYTLKLERDEIKYNAYKKIINEEIEQEQVEKIKQEIEKYNDMIKFVKAETLKIYKQQQLTIDACVKRGYDIEKIKEKINMDVEIVTSEEVENLDI